jgi:hypothetical protein
LNTIALNGPATLPGRTPNIVTRDELISEGWKSYRLQWLGQAKKTFYPPDWLRGYEPWGQMHNLDVLDMRNFNVLGDIPLFAGLYVWSLDHADHDLVDLRYVGHSEHLPMVTHGKAQGGRPASGNWYGRPDNAGSSRMWVNALLTMSKS